MESANNLPSLTVVTGRPGSGKTTLARELAWAIRCPLISRDEIKEGLVNTTGLVGAAGDELGRQVYDVFFETMALLLRRRITLVAEAAFQHKLWAPKLEALREIGQIRIVLCSLAPEIARSRHLERSRSDTARERFHNDSAFQAQPVATYDPPHLEDVPTLTVDTSDRYQPSIDAIVLFAGLSRAAPAD